MTTRGMVGGVFCGRLTSGLWLGTIRPRFLGNTREFKALYSSILTLSAALALMITGVVGLYGLSWGIKGRDVLNVAVAVLATMAFASVAATPISAFVAFTSFRHGLDPDVVTYPVGSTTSDIVVTCCYAATLALMYYGPPGRLAVHGVCAAFLSVCAAVVARWARDEGFRRALGEALTSSIAVVVISGSTGTVLGQMNATVGLRPEVALAYPALIDTVGDVGSIVGSTATTKLWSGELEAKPGAIKEHSREVAAAWSASACMFVAYALISAALGQARVLPALLAIFLLANLIAVGAVALLSFMAGIATYRHGLDPDNFVIPIESSAADAITTLSLLIAISALLALGVR